MSTQQTTMQKIPSAHWHKYKQQMSYVPQWRRIHRARLHQMPLVHHLWDNLGIFNLPSMISHHWLIHSKNSTPKLQYPHLEWFDLFPFLIWGIWINRNYNNTDNTNLKPSLKIIYNHALEYHFLSSRSTPSQATKTIRVKWHAPSKGWTKLNIYGACNKTDNDIGGVFRSNTGKWILGFHKLIL